MNVFNKIQDYIDHILLILFFTILSMGVYALGSKEPLRDKVKSTIRGGLIAMILSLPTWLLIGRGYVVAMIPIVFAYTVAGQFIPEFLQKFFPKYFNKIAKDKTGVSTNDSES